MFALGLVAGLVLTVVLYVAGFAFASIWHGAPSGARGSNFGVYQGSAWFFFLTLPALVSALILLYAHPRAKRFSPRLRAFATGALCFALGGMSLCNLFSIGDLFPKAGP